MKHIQEITYGQKVQLYKMSDGFIKRVNDRMDEEIKKKTFIDATDSLSAKIKKEYRIIQWLDKVDTDREIIKAIQHTYDNTWYDRSFSHSISINDAWINDQVENEYQTLHKHSGASEVGFASVMFLRVPDFGKEYTETSVPHNGRLSLVGNCGGLFSVKHHLVEPEVGDFYIFPYDLEHLVYPFRGKDTRRSLSINFDLLQRKLPAKPYKRK
tara:strand:- start:129 stop:764 length:636 start_codon:yes stop_codon:yes gene_type:complete